MHLAVHYTQLLLVHLIVNKKITDVNVPQVSCERAPSIHFYPHGALFVLRICFGLVQVPLVMHKHNVSYIIWHVIMLIWIPWNLS